MRIGIVTQFAFPESHDNRCRKLVKTLAFGGHSVTVFTPSATAGDLERLGITVKAPAGPELLRWPFPFNEYWRRWLTKQGEQLGIECFMSKQLRLAAPTWLAASRLNAKFVLDLSENYPAMVEVEREGEILLRAFRNAAAFLESFCARRADVVTVVTESNRSRLIGLGIEPERITVVSNTPELGQRPRRNAVPGRPLGLVYVGLLSKVRCLDRLFQAMCQVKDRGALHLHIYGTGSDRVRLEVLRDQLELRPFVTFHGWLPHSQLSATLSQYHVGVVPHVISEHTNTTIPGKLFDYMAAGLPVLATAISPCQEVIEEARCGWVALDNPDSLHAALETILETTPEERVEIAERGWRAIQSHYNWKVDGDRFLSAIDALSRQPVNSP